MLYQAHRVTSRYDRTNNILTIDGYDDEVVHDPLVTEEVLAEEARQAWI